MTRRKDLIIEKYCILEKSLLKDIDVDILPNLDEIDLTDMVFIINYQFMNITTESQYANKINEMIVINGLVINSYEQSNGLVINEEKMYHIIPLISNFVLWLKHL